MSTDVTASILGRYEMISSDNYSEFLKAIGVGMIQRNLAEKAKPTVEISVAGGRWTVKRLTALKNTESSFIPGEEFDEEIFDGRTSKSTVVMDGSSKLVHTQRLGDDVAVTTSVFDASDMKETYSAKGVTSTRVFKRL